MKDEIKNIFIKLKNNKISLNLAEQQILTMLVDNNVLQHLCKHCNAQKKNETGLCKECHKF